MHHSVLNCPTDALVLIDTFVQWTRPCASGLIATVNWIPQQAAYMSEKKTAIVAGESRGERYAVIECRWTDVSPERFVIAYRDEESLRELIAAPSIIGIGFGSREAAVAGLENCSSTGAASKNSREKLAFDWREDDHRGTQSPMQRLRQRIRLTRTRSIACATLQGAIAAGILMFYSRSVLGAAIRSLVGASF